MIAIDSGLRRSCIGRMLSLVVATLVAVSGVAMAAEPEVPAAPAEVAPAEEVAPAKETMRVVVYKLKSEEALAPLAKQLTDDMLIHLGKKAGLIVVGEDEIQVMLSHEKDKEVMLCEDEQKCLAKLSEAINADKVITGHLGRIGTSYLVTLKLANAAKAVVEGGESAEAQKPGELVVVMREAIDRMLGEGSAADKVSFKMEVAPEGTAAAVVDLEAHGVDAQLGKSLTQLLSLELKKFEGLSVISRDEVQTMLRFEADKQMLQCTSDTSCLVEIGGALGVDYLVSGSVGKLGDAFVVILKLMDIHEAKVVSRSSESFRGVETDLAAALRFSTYRLLGHNLDGAGELQVSANVEEGTIQVQGMDEIPFPHAEPFTGLSVGKVGVSVTAADYQPLFQETYVFKGLQTDLRLSLIPLPQAWYKRWYVWASVGAVVVGAVTTAILLSDSPDPGAVTVRVD